MSPSIGIVIPTFKAAKHLPHCLPILLKSSLKPRILVIDSSSPDDTVALAKQMGAETVIIPKQEFNHGATRECARQYLKTDIVVMMTQDAYPASLNLLEELVSPLLKHQASIAYARQIPHKNAGFFEAFPRSFNYPAESHIRSVKEASQYGPYTFFCSNSCAAYLNQALDDIGGFPHVLFGEDTIVVAKLLHRGHKIAYVATAEVHHSHDYSLKQEFIRHFDMAIARHGYKDLLQVGGSDTRRGKEYMQTMLSQLKKERPSLIPYALLQALAKLAGYRFGKASFYAPNWFKKRLSGHPSFWKN